MIGGMRMMTGASATERSDEGIVGYGHKALGVEPIQLLYMTDRHYNPADELRPPYDDPTIAYNWET
jgi:dTDP-4-dehydrorhamnose 3,5-epimerase-like enzyme